MASPAHNANAVSQDTLITIKISVNENMKKLKLPLRDLGGNVLPDKVRLGRSVTQGVACKAGCLIALAMRTAKFN